jgi:diguanylate cyclase (GGDEF)-like protein
MLDNLPTSSLPLPIEKTIRTLLLRIIPVIVVAAMSFWVSLINKTNNSLSLIELPIVSLLLIVLLVRLIVNKISEIKASKFLIAITMTYITLDNAVSNITNDIYSNEITLTWTWITAICSMIFIVFDTGLARRISTWFIIINIITSYINLFYKYNFENFLNILHPILASIVCVFFISFYANMRHDFSHMHFLATKDPLTKLHNRRFGYDHIQEKIQAHESFYLFLLDIDHFKKINDEYGHTVGDQVLCEVGECITSCLRDNSILCRWGGEEFLVLSAGLSQQEAQVFAETLVNTVRNHVFCEEISLTLSVGGAVYLPDERLEDVVSRTDAGLYAAKRSGRDRFCFREEIQSTLVA